MTVAELGQRMSSRELSEWMAFYQLEPFGPEADDLRNAISTAANVNTTRGAAGIKQSVKPQQFLIGEPIEQGHDENPLLSKFMAISGRLEGTADGDHSESEYPAQPR